MQSDRHAWSASTTRAALAEALKRTQTRPSGNWYVVGASRELRGERPVACTVEGREVVVWRNAQGSVVAGPGICPHLGAPLADSPVRCGTLVCHWHGLALDGKPFAGWQPWAAHDDGVLLWVRLEGAGGEPSSAPPMVPARPETTGALVTVYTGTGICEPADVIANRLDPWHGAWFHPCSFVDLTVVDAPSAAHAAADQTADEDDAFTVDVSFRWPGASWCPYVPDSPLLGREPWSCGSATVKEPVP